MVDKDNADLVARRVPIASTDVVVRGGDMEDWKLQQNAEAHNADPRTPDGEWAISIATSPGLADTEIVATNNSIRQKTYRRSTGKDLANNFTVVRDHGAHGLILLDGPPDAGTCDALRALFSENIDNPYYEQRRRRRNAP